MSGMSLIQKEWYDSLTKSQQELLCECIIITLEDVVQESIDRSKRAIYALGDRTPNRIKKNLEAMERVQNVLIDAAPTEDLIHAFELRHGFEPGTINGADKG